MDVNGRALFYIPVLDAEYTPGGANDAAWQHVQEAQQHDPEFSHHYEEVDRVRDSNLIGSLVPTTGKHKPVLDLDFACRLLPSKTEGHYHLYLDGIDLEWDEYVEVLTVLAKVGILEQGYVNASVERGMTRVRTPKGEGKQP